MNKGLFIVLEGPDGSGKTTQIELLKEYLQRLGKECIITREPGGTRIGESIRNVILNPEYDEMSDVTEMLLYAASRAQLVHDVIGPAIDSGKVVISDRFVDSSAVYQGIGRGLGQDTVNAVNAPAIGSYRPDKIIFIDLSEEEGIRRKKKQKKLDRIEQAGLDFHRMVADGYRQVLSGRDDVVTIDGDQAIEEIQARIRAITEELLEQKKTGR